MYYMHISLYERIHKFAYERSMDQALRVSYEFFTTREGLGEKVRIVCPHRQSILSK
jgi:hypothetical protein